MLSTQPMSGGMGMHLLQKMGWKPGEGLGKEKNGSLQPLLLEVKLDKKGLVADEEVRLQFIYYSSMNSTQKRCFITDATRTTATTKKIASHNDSNGKAKL